MIGNFIRAIPIFVIEEYYYMFLVLGQFVVIAAGYVLIFIFLLFSSSFVLRLIVYCRYYGVNRMNAWLLLFFILGNLGTSAADGLLAVKFTRSSIDPDISK